MALSARRTRKVDFKVKSRSSSMKRKIVHARTNAMHQLSIEMEEKLKTVIGKQGSRFDRSKPGEPPRRQTGYLQENVSVEFVGGKQLTVRSPQYGTWLDGGTGRMAARPWLRRTIHDKQAYWDKRFRDLMKRFMH